MTSNPFGAPQYKVVLGFKLRAYGSSLQVEEDFLEELRIKKIEATLPYLRIAERIAKENQVDDTAAVDAVQNFATGSQLSLVGAYIEDLRRIETETTNYDKLMPTLVANVALQNRLDARWLSENEAHLKESFGIAIGEEGWQLAHTEKLPLHVRIAISNFMTSEINMQSEDSDPEPQEDESLGKSVKGFKQQSKTPKRTGRKSTTQSSLPDTQTPAGTVPTSGTSLLLSSSRP